MFSVVIPVYNKCSTIGDTLQCLVEQSHLPREIIVVDDGSDDGSLEIVRAFENSHVKILSTPSPRSGPSAARNVGIKAATQEWVSFLDADDFWSPNYLQSVKSIIESAGPSVVGAFTAWNISDGRLDRPRRTNPFSRHRPAEGTVNLQEFLEAWLRDAFCPIWTSASSFKKAALIKAGMFDEKIRRGEDKQLWLKMLVQGPAAYTTADLATYNMNVTGQLTSKVSTDLHPVCDAVDELKPGQPPEIQSLLDRLYNLQVWQYAVQVKLRERLPRSMFGHFRFALNPMKYLVLHSLSVIPGGFQRRVGALLLVRRGGASS